MANAQQEHRTRTALTRRGALTLAAASALTAVPTVAEAGPRRGGGHEGRPGDGPGGRHGGRPPRLPETVALPAGIRPEGITSGPGTRFYVGSLADGRIVTGDLRRAGTTTLLAGAAGRQLRGLFHDGRTGLVWAAGNVGTVGHVWAVDGRTGEVVADVVVPGAVFLNDLVVARGAVWVTDSRIPADRLTVIRLDRRGRPTSAAPTFLPLSGDWPVGDGTAVNANGIRALSDGSLVLNNSRTGGLFAVDPQSGAAREIPVSGGPGLVGGDGLVLSGRTLYDVRGSGQAEVSVLCLDHSRLGWTATWKGALTAPTLDVPSTATLAGGSLWAVNARFGVASPETADYWVTRLRAC